MAFHRYRILLLFHLLLSIEALTASCRSEVHLPVAQGTFTAIPSSVPVRIDSIATWTSTVTTWPSTWTPTPTHAPSSTATRVVVASLGTPSRPVPSATTAHTPLPEVTSTPVPQTPTEPAPIARLNAWTGTLVVDTYDWEGALVDTTPGDIVYPYPRLDHSLVGPPVPRTYRTIILENDYVRLTLLPELGGRIYRWLDKRTGREMYYRNPVIKPTRWGARGWWFATGGMEWAFPVDEHGLVEWQPWSYRVTRDEQQVGIVLSCKDERTGLLAEVSVTLEAGRSYITIAPRISNPTEMEQAFQFWINGMFALSPSNRPGAELRFALPGNSVTVHSTGDPSLPGAGEEMGWPVHNGRDMSRYGNWGGWLGIFAWNAGYIGVYDPVSDMGVVRVCPVDVSRGAKIFGPASLDPELWTDDGSGYVELWGGLTRTFWDYTILPAQARIGWQERWYAINDLGGLGYANEQAALWLTVNAGQIEVGAVTTRPLAGKLVLWSGDQVVAEWAEAFVPGTPFRGVHHGSGEGAWKLQLVDSGGRLIAAYGNP